MTLIKGKLKPAKESQSQKHDRICVSLYNKAPDIIPWVSQVHSQMYGWKDLFSWEAPRLEYPIMKPGRGNRPPKTVGYIDMMAFGKAEGLKAAMLFEVKPVILSLGELLRQIHRYKECINQFCGGIGAIHPALLVVAVVSASNEYAEVLRDEKIVFIDTAWLPSRDAA